MNPFEWFYKIVGFSEKKWNYQLDTLPPVIINGMGKFETKTIRELSKKTKNYIQTNKK